MGQGPLCQCTLPFRCQFEAVMAQRDKQLPLSETLCQQRSVCASLLASDVTRGLGGGGTPPGDNIQGEVTPEENFSRG